MPGSGRRRKHLREASAGTGRDAGPSPLLSCRVAVTLPPGVWMRSFSEAHPHTRIEIVDRFQVGPGRTIFDLRIPRQRGTRWEHELERIDGVDSAESLGFADGEENFRVVYSGATFLPFLARHGIPRRHPYPIRAGVATWELVAPEPKIRSLLRSLEREGVRFRVESIHRGSTARGPHPPPLTARQREILRRAVAEGYFEVPRRVSLTRLAAKLGVAASTLSVAIAVIERKIVSTVPH